ncbi:CDP-glycerol glycerophosphotransferase family protein [soil metagenome]
MSGQPSSRDPSTSALARLAKMPATVRAQVRRFLYRRYGGTRGPVANVAFANMAMPADIVVHFPDDIEKLYQLEQWLPVLEELDRRRPVLLVMRNLRAFRAVSGLTHLRTLYVRRFADLMDLYDDNDYKAALYVNNGYTNFQSLASGRMFHVQIGHGESDKICMVSHQNRAYDRVLVAGGAAVTRHQLALLEVDLDKLVPVGRPQLDLDFLPLLPQSTRRTLLYAPTWEGENSANNYTSVDCYGVRIVEALLQVADARVVYRPHPRVGTSSLPDMAQAHQRICQLIDSAATADTAAGHRVELTGPVLALVRECDAMVADVSSVGLDFLYLRTERPLFLTDRRNDRAQLAMDAPVCEGADVVDASTVSELAETITKRLEHDELRETRLRLRQMYFGDVAVGESTQRFMNAVEELVEARDQLIRRHETHAMTAG